jgi:hypothetical protein
MITKTIITDLFNRNEFVALIREYRICTGVGLKESRDIIEANRWNLEKLMNVFAPYFPATPETPETKIENMKSEEEKNKEIILKGMTTACNAWKDMGFPSPLDACQIVIVNLKNQEFSKNNS